MCVRREVYNANHTKFLTVIGYYVMFCGILVINT